MFSFGAKKKTVPSGREKRQRVTTPRKKTKEDFKDDLAVLGLLGLSVDETEDDGLGSESDDESNLEDELMAIIGLDAEDSMGAGIESQSSSVNLSSKLIPTETQMTKTEDASQKQVPGTMPDEAPVVDIFHAPPPPETVMEALQQRLEKYTSELKKATEANESGKARRMGRIVKQYEQAISSHKKGRPVLFEELPTPPGYGPIPTGGTVSTSVSQTSELVAPLRPMVPSLNSDGGNNLIDLSTSNHEIFETEKDVEEPKEELSLQQLQLQDILGRQKQFKEAALKAKKEGAMEQAKQFLKISKGFDKVIEDLKEGLQVDMAALPSSPEAVAALMLETSDGFPSVVESTAELPPANQDFQSESQLKQSDTPQASLSVPNEAPPVDIFHAPPPPETVMEALQQRLEKYKSEIEKANETNNSGKARRMGRIVKQYEEAITAYKKGRPVIFDELPTPPGYGPIPIPTAAPVPISPVPAIPGSSQQHPSPTNASGTRNQGSGSAPTHGSINRGANKPQTKLTLQEKQLNFIVGRQKQFREAALNAKKRGDIGQAKEFLKTAIGFDKLIEASQAGLPVDMATLPSPPEAVAALMLETSDDFEIISSSDCVPPPVGSAAEIFAKLEEDLREQLKMCMKTREHFKNIGDVASANRFEKLAIETKKDLDALRICAKQNDELPKYHYETKIFSITECNSDLADDEIEVSIIKGINYKVPNPADVDTFVKIEFPYPSAEDAQTNKTAVVRDTNNPDYEATFKLKISRTERRFQRFIHRHGVKLEVWSKGGFLRSSSLIGGCTVKLLPLETKCVLHDAFDVLEGRRSVGKIEVKVRLREPILTKQITQKKEKWLSIDRV